MHSLKTLLARNPKDYQNIMMWAACCVAFFGCLRCSEFTVPDQTSYDPASHLSFDDVSVDNKVSPRMILLHIKQSKTDATRQGAQVVLGVTGKDICPVKALLPYLVIRRAQPGPLFITPDNHHLTQPLFRSMLHSLLKQVGLRAEQFNTHSFRIGAATVGGAVGLSEVQIKTLGRWKSNAYQCYVRPTPSQLAVFSKQLASEDIAQPASF